MTNATSGNWTPLTHIGFGQVMDLSGDTITTNGVVQLAVNGLVGLEINPNIDQEVTFTVISNTADTIIVDVSSGALLTDVAAAGDTYCGIYRFDNVYFRRGGFMVLGDQMIVEDTMAIDEYGRLSHYDATTVFESRLDLTVEHLNISATGSINVNARGYLGGRHNNSDDSGYTIGNTLGATYRSGGSHGGLGGAFDGIPNGIYGSMDLPVDLGSGGSRGYYNSNLGGDGGGRIEVTAQTINVEGMISANGGNGGGGQAGSGSGGSILLFTNELYGSGTIQANGGNSEVGGGGGRVAIHYNTNVMEPSLFRVLGGQGSYSTGGNGTLFLKQSLQTYGDLVVDGLGSVTPGSSSPIPPGYIFDNVILRNSARVVADNPIVVNDSLQVLTGSILTHSQGSEDGLVLDIGTLIVDETSRIDVTGKGYNGGRRDGNSADYGLTLGSLPGANYRSGGSYGGYGGVYDGPGSNAPYGHPNAPVYLGSGGSRGYYGSQLGGNGGGRVTIVARLGVEIEGSILANGQTGGGGQAGSGSGGSIYIETSKLSGAGYISADGGIGEVGGGGGRIAAVYDYLGTDDDDLNGLRNITAFGGHGSYNWGSAGTVLLKKSNQTYGDLYIDDNMTNATSGNWTPLTHIGFGQVMDLSGDTITTNGVVQLAVNGLVGLEINPNIDQEVTFTVISNTADTIIVDVSSGALLTDVAAAGDTYCGIYRFDNVYFRRGGFMVLGDQMIVEDTMAIDEYGRLSHYDATTVFESRLDLTVEHLNISATGSINVNARGYLGGRHNNSDDSGYTIGNTLGATYRSGGSHGGLGGAFDGIPNGIYGSMDLPVDLGSGGSRGYYNSNLGGDGGGRIEVTAQTINVEGMISANGGNGGGGQAGSGSGGSILLFTNELYGSGTIQANGGNSEVGGGGGRIAIRYSEAMTLPEANVQSLGGVGQYGSAGEDGTINFP